VSSQDILDLLDLGRYERVQADDFRQRIFVSLVALVFIVVLSGIGAWSVLCLEEQDCFPEIGCTQAAAWRF
jgi:hypothetical protein